MRLRNIGVLLIVLVLISGCSARVESQPPDLIKPVSVKSDIVPVTRGDVVNVSQYKGLVRVKSDELFFVDTGLQFGAYYCLTGQEVEEGQLLASLDIESVEEEIKNQQDKMTNMRTENAFNNESIELDIAIAQVQLTGLMRDASQYNESAMVAAESKRMEIERLQLSLIQAKEKQELELGYAQIYLDELLEKLAHSEIRAPYDGVITYMQDMQPGDAVTPYRAMIYISDQKELFVEYAIRATLPVRRTDIVTGVIGNRVYNLERIPLTREEQLFYAINDTLAQPARYNILNPDDQLKAGEYVTILIQNSAVLDVLCVPVNAISTDADIGTYVYVSEDGHKVLRPVKIGLSSAAYTEILEGLEEGEEVYVKQ